MKYCNIIFPVNFYHKYYKLHTNSGFIKLNNNSKYLLYLVFEKLDFVVLEIGFGKGDFLIQYCLDNPDQQIIGIEKSQSLVKEVSKRLDIYKIKNVRLINSYAEFAIYFLIPDNFIDKVIINFPDPWPKKAHISRRLVNPYFLKMLYPKMKKNSTLLISTDVENYKDFILESIKKANNQDCYFKLNDIKLGFWNQDYQTKYLRKWIKQNRKIYSLEIVKH